MSKVRARPRYYRNTEMFPTLYGKDQDAIEVEFLLGPEGADEGCNGSGVSFRFHEFHSTGRLTTALSIEAWGDGLQNLMDNRIQAVVRDLHAAHKRRDRKSRWGHSDLDATPEQVIALLEKHGITAGQLNGRGDLR